MLNTLRRRLIISHLVPLLIIVPLIGIALVYTLETRILLPSLLSELTGQATLVTDIVADQSGIWRDPAAAQMFVTRVSAGLTARLMLFDSSGRLLASSDPADAARVGLPLNQADLSKALVGVPGIHADYSLRLHSDVVDIFVPVTGPEGQVLGVIRLTHRSGNVYELFMRLRYLIVGILLGGLLLGGAVGWALALNLAQPLKRITLAVYQLANAELQSPLTEDGPAEIRLLTHSINSFVERLQTLEQNRRQLLANLVHELGRPLGALHSAIQALIGGADEDEALRRQLLAGMDEEIARLRRLLDDLARLREQLTGTLELARQPVELGEWLTHLLATGREAARQKGLQWQAAVPPDLPALDIDPDRLAQAIGNLINNAIKYTPSGGRVSVEAGMDAGQVFIRVNDTGPGIAQEELGSIFDPFYRGRTGLQSSQGMGLGLSIARDLATAHGGRLQVESTPGQGSHFTVWLPCNSFPTTLP